MSSQSSLRLVQFSWVALIFWQICWHALLPEPMGAQSNWLATVAALPLLALTHKLIRGGHRGRFWGMLAVMLYFVVGVMEIWSNPEQRMAAWVQVMICCAYFLGLMLFSRSARNQT